MSNCLFCKIVEGEIPSYKVWEDEYVIAFLDIFPISFGHTLIIPKTHSKNYLELSLSLWSHMGLIAQKIAKAHLALGAEGTNLLVTQGEVAGQSIFHTHWHIIPRREGDNIKLGGSGELLDSKILEGFQEKLKLELTKLENKNS